jgi:polyhydroxybutyrate depolymerase
LAALAPGETNETVPVGSLNRSYFLHVPATYDGTKPVPLIVDFHFLGNSGLREQQISPFPEVTASEGVIVAFPNGENGPAGTAWNIGPCCVANDLDDVAFVRALVAQLRTRACIDANRIYAVGYGLGGGMAHYVGCHAADVFAGVAPVGFDLLQENVDDCRPTRALTVVLFRELSDTFVPYGGGTWSTVSGMPVTLLGAQATFAKWAAINQCSGSPTAEDSNGCSSYTSCRDGVEVVLCTQEAGLPVPDNGTIAWPILQRHPLP